MKTVLKIQIVALLLISMAFAGQPERFPKSPNLIETPGKLCSQATAHRPLLIATLKTSLTAKEMLIHIQKMPSSQNMILSLVTRSAR